MIGVILSSKTIENNLRVEFGEILPVELPIRNKQLLTHQVEALKNFCTDIYLTVPAGYTSHLIDYKQVIPIEIKVGSGLIDVFQQVSNHFSRDERIFIWYGDSLFLNIGTMQEDLNYFFVQKPIFEYGWGIPDGQGFVPAGGFVINNGLLGKLASQADNFDSFTKQLQGSGEIISFSDFEWLDFGHTLTYYHSRKRFLESRSFNRLQTRDGFIIKSSTDTFKIWCEYQWMKEVKKQMPVNVPYVTGYRISGGEASYSIEYINHPMLSDMFVFGRLSDDFFLTLLKEIKKLLQRFKNISFAGNTSVSSNFLADKLSARKNDIIKIASGLNADDKYISRLIDENVDYFSTKEMKNVPMHGDLCFSNILFNFSAFEPVMIDPRGYTQSDEGYSLMGPEMYDIYKLAHSYVLGYDFMIAGLQEHDFFEIKNVKKRAAMFCDIFECDLHDLSMGLRNLFLSMIPLHADVPARQYSFMNALSIIDQL